MNEEYIVLGAMGHIGFNVVKKLIELKKKVRVLVHNKKYESKLPEDVTIYYGDITDMDSLKEIFKCNKKTITYVINCINYYSDKDDDKKIEKINYNGIKNIVEMCELSKVDKYIHVTSIYSNLDNNYGRCKKLANELVLNSSINASIVYIPLVVGPNDYRVSLVNQYLYDYMYGNIKSFVDANIYLVDVRDASLGIINASLYGKDKESYYITDVKYSFKNILLEFAKYADVKKVRRYHSIDKLIKYENFMNRVWDIKKVKPIYNISLLNLVRDMDVNNKLSVKELDLKFRSLGSTMEDTYEYLKLSK